MPFFFVFFIQNAGSGALREMEAQRAGREEEEEEGANA